MISGTIMTLIAFLSLIILFSSSSNKGLNAQSTELCKPVSISDQLVYKITNNVTDSLVSNLSAVTEGLRNISAAATNISELENNSEFINLVKNRYDNLVSLLRMDPNAASSFLLDSEKQAALEKLAPGCVEEQKTVIGELRVLHADLLDNKSAIRYELLNTEGSHLILHPRSDEFRSISPGSTIKVTGLLLGNDLVIDTVDTGIIAESRPQLLESPLQEAVQGRDRVLILLINFNDTTPPSITPDQIRQRVVPILDQYYQENSYFHYGVEAEVFGMYQLAIPNPCITPGPDLDTALMAANPDVYFPNYKRIVLIGPYDGCGWAGSAYIDATGDGGVVNTPDGDMVGTVAWVHSRWADVRVIGHELGHNFGNNHASSLDCGAYAITPNFPSYDDCTPRDYGNPYDIMGSSTGHYNAPHKERVNWFQQSNILQVSNTGIYTIEPFETRSDGPKIIKVPRANGDYVYIEYRQPIGFDRSFPTNDAYDGATVQILSDRSSRYPYLLDMTPDGTNSGAFYNSSLKIGDKFYDPGSRATYEVLSANENGLTISISFIPPVERLISYKFVTKWNARLPGGIAVDFAGKTYVVDTGNRGIQEFDVNGRLIRVWGAGLFTGPLDIAIHGSNLFVTDYFGASVAMFLLEDTCPSEGQQIVAGICFIGKWGTPGNGPGQFRNPSGIAIDNSGRTLYVSDTFNSRIAKYIFSSPCPSGSTQVLSGLCAVSNIQYSEFVSPYDVALDTSGNVYVSDYGKHRIFKFTSSGSLITKWGFEGTGAGAFKFPSSIALDSSNSVYVVDERNYRIQKFDTNGKYITKWGSMCKMGTGENCNVSMPGAQVPGDGQFNFGLGRSKVAASPSGIYVTDVYNERVQKFALLTMPG
jgi:sugar lactone lactonase YvrE